MQITQGDLDPDLELTLADAEGLLDFDDAVDVAVYGYRAGVLVLERARSTDGLSTPSAGRILMPWVTGDTAVAGRITLQVVVTWATGVQTIDLDETVDVAAQPIAGAPTTSDLLSIEELVDHMSGVSLTPRQRAAGRKVLAGCIRGLERKLYRRFAAAQVSQRTWPGEDGWAPLSRTPVQRIVSVDGQVDGVWEHTPNGVWLGAGGTVEVVYVGGYAEVDDEELDDVKLAILEKCADVMTVRHDDTLSVKDLDTGDDVEKARKTAASWSDDEIVPFDRLRRRVVV